MAIRDHSLRALAALVATVALAGCGSTPVIDQATKATPFAGPLVARASVASMLGTYAPGSACASVQTATDIAKVPAPCRQAWQPYQVTTVPGQDLMHQVPTLPHIAAGPGVTQQVATLAAAAYWRSQAFLWYALQTDQPVISDGLGRGQLYRQSSADFRLELAGGHAQAPTCHAFPEDIRVVNLKQDFANEQHRYGKALGIQVSFPGPCVVTGTDKAGKQVQLHDLPYRDTYVIVGDVDRLEPFGLALVVSGVGQCSQAIVSATCAQ